MTKGLHPKRLVILQDHLRNGGTEQQSLAIAKGLSTQGLEVHLIVFRRGGTLDSQAAKAAVSLHFLNQGPLKTDWFSPGLSSLLSEIAPDAVLPMGRMANCIAGLLTRKKRNYKLIATFRTGRTIPYLYRRCLSAADFLVSNSQEALNRLNSEYGIHRPDTSTVIYNGCIRDFATAIPFFPKTPSKQSSMPTVHFVSVSMFRPQKKQIRLVRICSKLPENLNWKLTLAGEGTTRAACQAEVQRLGLSDRVHFPGLIEDPRSLYADADIGVHTSDQESLPNFLVEAQMSGLPVVAYDVNGVKETFLHNESGFLIPLRDEAAFITSLERLSYDSELRLKMSRIAREQANSKFSSDSQVRAYFRLLTQSI